MAIHRVPRGLSIVRPGSACPHCGAGIAWYDNVPVVSYVLLRARCRRCGGGISPRYPLVELGAGAIWALIALRLGWSPVLPAFLAFGLALLILSAIDLEHRRLPNRVLGAASLIAVALLVPGAALLGEWAALLRAALGALAYGVPILAIGLIAPGGIGGGDVKFAPYLGFHLGWFGLGHVFVGAFLGFLTGGVAGLALMALGRKGRKDPIPFGPFMALGALVAVLAGDPVLEAWLG